jgi:hypothetical protein
MHEGKLNECKEMENIDPFQSTMVRNEVSNKLRFLQEKHTNSLPYNIYSKWESTSTYPMYAINIVNKQYSILTRQEHTGQNLNLDHYRYSQQPLQVVVRRQPDGHLIVYSYLI